MGWIPREFALHVCAMLELWWMHAAGFGFKIVWPQLQQKAGSIWFYVLALDWLVWTWNLPFKMLWEASIAEKTSQAKSWRLSVGLSPNLKNICFWLVRSGRYLFSAAFSHFSCSRRLMAHVTFIARSVDGPLSLMLLQRFHLLWK